MAVPQASSRLELLQARFQQKQLQEKEQKLLQLYDQQQQRAYQVVQRGSAGSNGSSHGSTISQHTVTKTSTSSHATSTSQGGKVRQMFDERRQTTVKGIDRSYPLEPLENKPRKQTNGNAVQRNGNVTVSRQSVTVKRVARADANSNLNGGKPVVSYHEEITRESFGPSERHMDDDEFGNENRIAGYANGNHRNETHIEEVLDEDTAQRNRMMAKLHLMEYDETLKHRVKNDLESEEFPEDFMVDVPDKLPKQSVTKKLSQAEARLERFKNANAKRNSSVAKNTSTIGVPKRRSDPVVPTKSTSSGNEAKNRTQKIVEKGSLGRRESSRSGEPEVTSVTYKSVEETLSSSDSEGGRRRKSDSPSFFCRESEKSATTYAIDSTNAGRFSPDFSTGVKRSENPRYLCKESEKAAAAFATDSKTAGTLSPELSQNIKKRSESPKFFCKESEKSATTYAMGSKIAGRLSPDSSKTIKKRSESPKFFCKESEKSATTYAMGSKIAGRLSPDSSKTIKKRSESPKFFCKESEKSATTYAIDSKNAEKFSADFSRDVRQRSGSPKYLCKESDKSATTYAINSKTRRLSPDPKNTKKRSESPKFFCEESEKFATTYAIDSKTARKLSSESSRDMKHSRETESKRVKHESAMYDQNSTRKVDGSTIITDTDTVDRHVQSPESRKTTRTSSPETVKKIERKVESKLSKNKSPSFLERLRERSLSPQLFRKSKRSTCKDTKHVPKSPEPGALHLKVASVKRKPSIIQTVKAKSPDFMKKILRNSNKSPQFADSDRSSTIILVKPETVVKPRTEPAKSRKKQRTPEPAINKPDIIITNSIAELDRKTPEEDTNANSKYNIRNSVSRFFSEQCDRAARNANVKSESGRSSDLSRSSSPVSLKDMYASTPTMRDSLDREKSGRSAEIGVNRGNSHKSSPRLQEIEKGHPEVFCYETDKFSTTVSLKPKSTKELTGEGSRRSRSRDSSLINIETKSSRCPDKVGSTKGAKVTVNIGKSNSRTSSPTNPEFFCYETDRSATTVSLKPKSVNLIAENSTNFRPKSEGPTNFRTRASKRPDNFSLTKGNKVTVNINKNDSRDSSPKSRKIVDRSRSGSPEFFCYETDRSATTVSLKPKSTNSSAERSKNLRPKSNSPILRTRDSISPRNCSSTRDNKVTVNIYNNNSRGSSPRSQKIRDSRSGTPDFFCYETDRSATTISLKPKSKEDSTTDRSKSRPKSNSSTSIQFQDRSTESPDDFTQGSRTSSRDSSPKSQKIVDSRSGTSEFFCYEAEGSATAVSLKSKSPKDSINERSKSPRVSKSGNSPTVSSRNRSLNSPDNLGAPKNVRTTRRGSDNVLRSTSLIRDIIRHQKRKGETDCVSKKDLKDSRRTSVPENTELLSVKGIESKHRTKQDESKDLKRNEEATKRITSPSKPRELLASKSNPKSSISSDVDAEIEKITMPDRCIKREKIDDKRLQSTYSKSSCAASQGKKAKTESSFAYSARKTGRKRSSLFESGIFEASRRDQRAADRRASLEPSGDASLTREDEKDISLKQMTRDASSVERSCSSSPSSIRGSVFHGSKRGIREDVGGEKGRKILRSLGQTSPSRAKDEASLKRTVLEGCNSKQRGSRKTQALRSIELVRKTMKRESQSNEREIQGKEFQGAKLSKEISNQCETRSEVNTYTEKTSTASSTIETVDFANEGKSSSKDCERTDSVESALRCFDSIGTELGTASARSILERSKGLIAEKRQTRVEPSGVEGSDDSKTISLKALDRGNVNSSPTPVNETPGATSRKPPCLEVSKTRETGGQKKLAKARDSIELARTFARSKSPACRRRLFQDDSGEKRETGSSRPSYSLDSTKTIERLSRKSESVKSKADSLEIASKFLRAPSSKTSKQADKGETDGTSTGATNSDRSVSVKQLRSIEDIRKSIESKSPNRRTAPSKSAIANDALKDSCTVSRPRISVEDRGGNRKEMLRRSEKLNAKNNALGDSEGFVNCASRFSRVAKSPSPDPTKAEMGNRSRRSVPLTPSKSPDTATRRPSTDSKVQDTKPSRRPMPMKSTDPIGNRKTTTTTRKSTDVVDGAVLENGLHLRDQTAETKYDNDSSTTKKSEAFVIDFDEQPSKENDGPPARKPLLRKRSIEKQTPSTQSGRPPSSVSSTSSGSSMQASVARGRMASKAKAPISGTAMSKGSAGGKGGGSSCTVDGLLVPCKMCGRRFAQERVGLHEQICAKTGQKKRKQFDAMMHRVRGTELETFVRKGIGTCKKLNEKSKKPEVKSNWRRKHEDFINAIRSAKQVQAHLAAGGRLSDLPPPPASDTSDYVQCPHCGRKFNQSAAERHIPKCEHMLHNKPAHSRAPPKPRR